MHIPRRNFLFLMAGAFLPPEQRAKQGMIVHSARPEDLEMGLSGFSDYITPIDRFFVRSHVSVPTVDESQWRLVVSGDVATPATLTMADLRQLPSVEQISVLECAGNGRGFYEPSMPGLQWAHGGVGNGRWRGVRLADVLKRAGIRSTAREVLFDGADTPIQTMPDFQRSIPVEKALDPNTLLAYDMNGETLPVQHGFPLRAIVPGWASAASVKWLTGIRVLDKEHDGFWMATAYRHPGNAVTPGAIVPADRMRPVTSLRIKSVIADPIYGAQVLEGAAVSVWGVAWSGTQGPVSAVEVSVDGGRTWRSAQLRPGQRTRFGWRQWDFSWTPAREGFVTILSRAHDAVGDMQPLDQEWNPSGYLWNVVPRVGVNVVRTRSETPAAAQTGEESVSHPESFRAACLTCHGDDVIRQQRLTRDQWDREINKMTGWGARVAQDERAAFLDHLVSNFGPRARRR